MSFPEGINFQPSIAPKYVKGEIVAYSGEGDEPFYFDSKGNQTSNTKASRIYPGERFVVYDTQFILERILDDENNTIEEVHTPIIIFDIYGYKVRIKEAYIVS